VKVNCAALPETLLESELFGHEKGRVHRRRSPAHRPASNRPTAAACSWTKIGDMSPAIQAKILRVLQEHEFERLGGTRTQRVDVRLIAATNRDLSRWCARASSAKTFTTG
jgi:Nif-specific regulatory protein